MWVRDFLDSEEHFKNHDFITADYLWDFVLKVFNDDITNYGAVTERYNSYVNHVTKQGATFLAVFKAVLLLNAFNNVSGDNNNGLVTPSETNIRDLFVGTSIEENVDEILDWFNEQGIVQRTPGGLFSIQFSALPSLEIEEKKNEMRNVQYKYVHQVLNFAGTAKEKFKKKFMDTFRTPYDLNFYGDVGNDSQLRNQIKIDYKKAKSSSLYLALLFAKTNEEHAKLTNFATECINNDEDKDLHNIVIIVFDEVFGNSNYEDFIAYQANSACASAHGFLEQQNVHRSHAIDLINNWMDCAYRNNATVYTNNAEPEPFSVRKLSLIIRSSIAPRIFYAAPFAHELLRQKVGSSTTFWKQQVSKEIVRTFLFAKGKDDFDKLTSQMKPITYLLQDCLDDNLQWKPDTPENHPFKVVYDKINSTIKHADKSLQFNYDEKFSYLTQAPYGYYSNYATMATFAFAMREWVNKVFDMQGKPRDANAMVDDIATLFEYWNTGKVNLKSKLNFKFQTPEEGRLCKEFVSLFGLNAKGNEYTDVSSLKDARYAIVGVFLEKMQAPLWVLKYTPASAVPVTINMSDNLKRLIDNIVKICSESDQRNSSLINDTISLIGEYRDDMKNLLKSADAFKNGFAAFLKHLSSVNPEDSELESLYDYIKKNLQSTVGYWTEEEVELKATQWRASKNLKPYPAIPNRKNDEELYNPQVAREEEEHKKIKAKQKIKTIATLADAIALLEKVCENGYGHIWDIINGEE